MPTSATRWARNPQKQPPERPQHRRGLRQRSSPAAGTLPHHPRGGRPSLCPSRCRHSPWTQRKVQQQKERGRLQQFFTIRSLVTKEMRTLPEKTPKRDHPAQWPRRDATREEQTAISHDEGRCTGSRRVTGTSPLVPPAPPAAARASEVRSARAPAEQSGTPPPTPKTAEASPAVNSS